MQPITRNMYEINCQFLSPGELKRYEIQQECVFGLRLHPNLHVCQIQFGGVTAHMLMFSEMKEHKKFFMDMLGFIRMFYSIKFQIHIPEMYFKV